MSLSSENMSPADIAAVTGNGNGYNWGGDGSFWIIVLFLFALMGNNGWNNGFGGNAGSGVPFGVQQGFDQAAVINGINGLSAAVNAGFANAEVANCNRAADAMQTAYSNQIANMNQNFANQQFLSAQLNGINSTLQQACSNQAANLADLKYTVATEACADRSAISSALRDVLEANNASTQRILDQMCQDRLNAKDEQISNLQQQLTMANLAASQTAQTAQILAGQAAEIDGVYNRLKNCPVGTYSVTNPLSASCGCGCSA